MISNSLSKSVVSLMLLVSTGPQAGSITLSLAKPATDKPSAIVVSISIQNDSPKPLSLTKRGALLDFSIRLTNVTNGLAVPLTEEGHDLRYGTPGGFRIMSAQGFDLPPGRAITAVLELSRYFQIKPKGKYRLQVIRDLGSPPSKVASNVLVIEPD